MVNRSETQRKAHESKVDEGFRCSGCMFHAAQIEIRVQWSSHAPSASRNRFTVKYSG